MEARISIPVSLPVSSPLPSPWQDLPSEIADHGANAPLPTSANIVIIGSGITGSTAAFEYLAADASQSVLMLEARSCASGASGRNGGHTKGASYRAFLDNERELGTKEAVKIVKLEYACFRGVHEFARTHNINCDSWEGDTVDVIYDDAQWKYTKKSIAALKEAVGEDHPSSDYSLWNPEETETRYLTPGSCGSVTYPAGSIDAYAFTCGVLRLGLDRGLQLYTHTPAIALVQDGDGWKVTTPRGSVRADKVLLATNGYTAYLLPEYQGVIVPLRGEITVHRRGPAMPPASPPRTYSFIHSNSYDYLVQRPSFSSAPGDIVIGGGLTSGAEHGLLECGCVDDSGLDDGIMRYLEDSTKVYFGEHWGNDSLAERIRTRHSGIMGYTPTGRPFVGESAKKNLWLCAAFNGHGMVNALFAAMAVVAMMQDRDDTLLQDWLPAAYRVSPERLEQKFGGRTHVSIPVAE